MYSYNVDELQLINLSALFVHWNVIVEVSLLCDWREFYSVDEVEKELELQLCDESQWLSSMNDMSEDIYWEYSRC